MIKTEIFSHGDLEKMLIKVLTVLTLLAGLIHAKLCTKRCYPGNDCFPTKQSLEDFGKTFSGELLFPADNEFDKEILTWNRWFTKSPAVIVFPKSVNDVRAAMLFAKSKNLHVTIRSSGHDFIGRSTFPGSFMINLSRMKNVSVDLTSSRNPAGEATIESGAQWGNVYQLLDGYNRVIVGGSAHTVAQGGYFQGGGHSPVGRSLGLAVDQILDLTVVSVDGRIIKCNATGSTVQETNGSTSINSDTDLFWALRGGGGGTFGVVVSYTYRLHFQPTQMTVAYFSTALSLNGDNSIGIRFFEVYNEFVKNMPKGWGGYMIMSNTEFYIYPYGNFVGLVTFVLNHFGTVSQASMDALNKFKVLSPSPWYVVNVTSFWQYAQNVTDGPSGNGYLANTFVQRDHLNDDFRDYMLSVMTKKPSAEYPSHYCTGTHIGVDLNSTPVHPGFRSGLISLSCSVDMGTDPERYGISIKRGKELYSGLKRFGNGVYVNEPSPDMSDWKEQFWGNHYTKLLEIKRKWDPDNFLYCVHCVGSDMD
ncbi:hypothetical protein KUTeg_000319 [Tegillarca granosa]|uniref:FAD-binding PCMH-type domain-containing protein n=1 Tax=Tegillarca granosa TaxID=220873 RepID=A0ABQ9FX68_TEGGR|nr:hypothetical protein KUTeg_000319 [Tegillarca granosa]